MTPNPLALNPLPVWARNTENGIEIRVKVVPGASRSEIVGPLGDRLKIRVAAPPEDGKANKAVVKLLKTYLQNTELEIVAGLANPEKTILVRI